MDTEVKKIYFLKWLIMLLAIFFILSTLTIGAWLIFEYKYKNLVYPGVYLGEIELGGKTLNEAEQIINNRINNINDKGVKIVYHNQETTLLPLVASLETDLAYQLFDYNAKATIDQIFSYGREGNYFKNLKSKFRAMVVDQKYKARYVINEPEVKKFLTENFSHFETPAVNAKLIYTPATYNSAVTFAVEEEKYGQIIDYDNALLNFNRILSSLSNDSLELAAGIDYPKILKKDALNINALANEIYTQAPIVLRYNYKTWKINKDDLIDWLVLKYSDEDTKEIIVGLDHESAGLFFSENIATVIDQVAIDGKFEITDGRVEEFQASQDGIRADIEANVALLEKELIQGGVEEINVITQIVKSTASIDDINDFGIKERLGVGHSSFSGSPSNRRHNIKVGADTLNGVLIAPDEEFSLIGTLGDIDGEAGYLPELVIKDNKTVPEFGGGLCQIGTTLFRATYETGLPVTQRRNHSYRVSYYEPAGTDATIYDPWPDYRFMNDTGNYLLLQTKIDGDDIYFEFWGTSDGRKATHTYPVITDIVRPGPTKIIETLDLEPGVKKCTEHAHNGANAYFDYTVEYSSANPPKDAEDENDLIRETRFKSHYVPWREVCLLGVEQLTEDKDKEIKNNEDEDKTEETATSTKEN